MFQSTKVLELGSCAFRQPRASHSHCRFIHGYKLSAKFWFESKELDIHNWVVDFGGFKDAPIGNGLKKWMDHMWDHTLLIEEKDPYVDIFEQMGPMGLAKVHILKKLGAEACAKLVFDKFNDVLSKTDAGRCKVVKVECYENDKNSAIYEE